MTYAEIEKAELANRVLDCISDGYDDEEYRCDEVEIMCGILAKGNENPDIEYLENVIKALVEQVEELQ